MADAREDSAARDRYALLASALAGRGLEVAWLEQGARAFTDGHTVFVPRGRLEEAWLDVSLQAVLVRNGALARRALHGLIARPERARGYLALELSRALEVVRPLLPRRVLEHPALAPLPAPPRDLEHSLAAAGACARALPNTPVAWGVLLPGRVLRAQRGMPDAGVGDPAATAPAAASASAREREQSRLLNAFRAASDTSVGALGRLLAKLLELGPGEAAAPQGGAGGELQGAGASREGAGSRAYGGPAPSSGLPAFAARRGRAYPEWDARRGRYRPDWVHVAEVEPEPAEDAVQGAPQLARLSQPAVRALRRTLRNLCLGYEVQHHQPQGDDVEVDALVRLRADALSGHVADERIYRASLRTRRDLGVLVLLDSTGSTRDRGPDGVSVFERQLGFALTLAQALHDSGDRVACYAFHGWGRKLVRLPRVLGFGQRPDAAMLQRAAWLSPVGYSRLGAAIRHGTGVLAREAGTPYRLLVLVSDGFAYDQGYEAAYARADTRRALHEARAQATACVCLSLGSSTDAETLADVFGGAHYLAVPALSGAERSLGTLFERAVQEASRRRRAR